ncbi:MAG: hypothetical protein MPK75_07155 [Alphaproteobacteria bacterium]|nr:hypothetical protein [Alphaproteobacteria bacterium]
MTTSKVPVAASPSAVTFSWRLPNGMKVHSVLMPVRRVNSSSRSLSPLNWG